MATKSTSPSDINEQAAGFVLYREDEASGRFRFLVLKHRRGGHWAFPKGRIEPGESIEQAARRELEEETGLDRVDILDGFSEVSRYSFRRGTVSVRKQVTYLLGRVSDHVVRLSSEHTDSAWLSEEDAASRLTFSQARQILRKASENAAPRGSGERGGHVE